MGMNMLVNYDLEPLFYEITDRAPAGPRQVHRDITPIFEIIYPQLNNILNYGDREELVLLTVYDRESWTEWDTADVDELATACGFPRPETYSFERDQLGDIPFPEDNFEGYVVRFDNGFRVKLKDPRYVKAHKLLSGSTTRRVIEVLRDPVTDLETFAEGLAPAFRASLDDAVALVRQRYSQIEGAARAQHARLLEAVTTGVRKDQALWTTENVPADLRGLVFGLLDGRDISPGLWKLTEASLSETEDGQI